MRKQEKNTMVNLMFICLIVVCSIFFISKPVQAAEMGQVMVSGQRSYSDAWQVLHIVNQERAKQGLSALTMDADLLDAAMQRAYEIAICFDHQRPNGEMCFTATEKMFGENIAAGQMNPSGVMNSWMHSPGHRSNILGENYASIGIGVVNVNGTSYWVQCFGGSQIQAASKDNYRDATVSAAVSFDQQMAPIHMNIEHTTLYLGDAAAAKLSFGSFFGNVAATNRTLVFQSSNPAVCTVDGNGKIYSVGIGTAEIRLLSPMDGKVLSSVNVTVTIHLKKTTIQKVTVGKKKLTLKWKKQKKNTDGYEIQYSRDKKFRKGVKVKTIKNNKKNTKTIKKLKKGKTYYIRIRTYKEVVSNGQIIKIYSDWSSKKKGKIQ